MNLIGNSLKYTPSGFVAVSLRAQEKASSNKIEVLIRVVDSGKGMSEDFQRDKLFLPFSQEDSFQPGTGLGLSIVKQIVDSLGGRIEVKSQQQRGTEVDVHLDLIPGDEKPTSTPDDILMTSKRTKGLNMILDPSAPAERRPLTDSTVRLEETLRAVCSSWFDMHVYRSNPDEPRNPDICLYSEPPSMSALLEQHHHFQNATSDKPSIPIIIVCATAEEAIEVSRLQGKELRRRGAMIEVIPQPCGPRKLAKILRMCLDHADERSFGAADGDESNPRTSASSSRQASQEDVTSTEPGSTPDSDPQELPSPATAKDGRLSRTINAALSFPSPPPLDPNTPALLSPRPASAPAGARNPTALSTQTSTLHVLLVDDNKINLQLLVMFMKKHQFSYAEAENGQEALDKFKEACLPGPHSDGPNRAFDVCLMDISMPVMNGMDATKGIREFEAENGLPRTTVIALTGLASAQAQKEAQVAGIDVFLPKPVKFAELKKLLDQKA